MHLAFDAEQSVVAFHEHIHFARMVFERHDFATQQREHAADVEWPIDRTPRSGLEPRELEQIVDDAAHAFCLTAHLEHGRVPCGIEILIVRQRIEVAGDDRERRAQLMRGIGHEILADRLDAHFATDIAHDQQLSR